MNRANLVLELRDKTAAITDFVIATDYARRPELMERYGLKGRAFYKRDNDYHLAFLCEAIASDEPALFLDYVIWARSMLTAHGVHVGDLVRNLELLKEAINHHFSGQFAVQLNAPITEALAQLPTVPEVPPSFVQSEQRNGGLAQRYLAELLKGDRRGAAEVIVSAVKSGVPLRQIYLDVFQSSQREIGRLWQLNQITVPEEHFCTAATMMVMNQFYRDILNSPRNGLRAVCCCIEGDLHEIGLRIIADFLELEGWDCDYFGANTPSPDLIKTLKHSPPDLIAVSATMTFHVDAVRALIQQIRDTPELAATPIMVGGRPFLVSGELWRQIGANASAADAEHAVELASKLVSKGQHRV